MTMDSNTGIFYAEGKLGKDTSLDQQAAINTQLDSPFNTYLYPGFGPTNRESKLVVNQSSA